MAIAWKIEEKNLVVFYVSGQLGINEYQTIQEEITSTAQKMGHISALLHLKDFSGWDADKDWGDITASEKVDPYIKKMAIVGDNKWRDLADVFTLKGLRYLPIEYFETSQEEEAHHWLE